MDKKELINAKIYNKLCEAESLSVISKANGIPDYSSYKHLLEDKEQINDLLELANEELKEKYELLNKV